MLNADDQYTYAAINRVKQAIREKRPLVIWVGAGASRWADLPSWHESARKMRNAFVKRAPLFQRDVADSYLTLKFYPKLFQLCRDADCALFNKVLLEQFNSPNLGFLYEQFVKKLKSIAPIQIVTTNVDLCLEQALGMIDVIERSDLERCSDSILSEVSFVAKLHGSISSIRSTVFTTTDYEQIVQSKAYLAAIRSIFSMASVIFLGHGLQDEYVLEMIAENAKSREMFGNGPHFLVTDSPGPAEDGVHRIAYKTTQHPDHRAALHVLDIIEQTRSAPSIERRPATQATIQTKKQSGFYISDFRPSGTQVSGQVVELGKPGDESRFMGVVGLGFTQGELPSSETVAFHDLAVGLTCFDLVFLPLESLCLLHDRATPEVFWALIDSGSIKFVDIVAQPFFLSTSESLFGDIWIGRKQDSEHAELRPSMSVVRKMLISAPGREVEAEVRIESLNTHVVRFSDSLAFDLASMVRDALLMPRVSQLLGYSDYILPNHIPRWLAYPTLRLAHLVETGLICNQLNIRASRVPFGGVSLLSAAFSVKPAEQSLYDYASFVMSGASGCNLSGEIEKNPRSLLSIIKFRESVEGEELRREVSDRLETNEGAEFSAAIEGSLRRAIPMAVVQAARNRFSTLMKTSDPNASTAALWSYSHSGDMSLALWREQSKRLLWEHAKVHDIKSDSPCLCGSGDRLRDCCLRPLK